MYRIWDTGIKNKKNSSKLKAYLTNNAKFSYICTQFALRISEKSFFLNIKCLLFSFYKNHEGGDHNITLQQCSMPSTLL